MRALAEALRMIKIEHSVFALPFALVAAFQAAAGPPPWPVLLLILAAMVSARSAAMSFNRLLDAELDAANPRTADRSIPSGRLSRRFAALFTAFMILIFLAVCRLLNPLAFALAPFALLVLLGYSATKRFTSLSHLVLGLALALSPVGAWVAVAGHLAWEPFVIAAAVLLWTAGFDILYACQDLAFDRAKGLHSIPARLGLRRSLHLSRLFHLSALLLFALQGLLFLPHLVYFFGLLCMAALLLAQHVVVGHGDLSRIDFAFFTLNGAVALLFGACALWAILLL
jgi:4-hydroxybenzoate polyprenyltransferase